MSRAERHTQRAAVEEIYSDIPINFDRNPVTGNLSRVTNEAAVKASIVQIIMAHRGEWPHYPRLGSSTNQVLFEPMDYISQETIRTKILQAIAQSEPRASVVGAEVKPTTQEDGYTITVWFYLVNSDTVHEVSGTLRRIR